MTGDNTKEQQQRRQQQDRRDEAILFSRFHRVATARLEDLMRQSEESGEGVNLHLGDAEQRILYSLHRQGVVEGLVAGVVTFAVLRKGPVYIARAVYRRRSREAMASPNRTGPPPPPSADGYQFSVPSTTATTTTTTTANNPFVQGTLRPDFPRSRNILVRSIWFTMDVMLSLMMAASVSMAYTDLEDITHQIVTLPLVPGRSLTSDALCDVIVKELALIQRENSPAYQRFQHQRAAVLSQQPSQQQQQQQQQPTNLPNQPSQSAVLYFQAIQDFAANCQRRAFVERSIRQQQGLDPSAPVEIPTAISPTAPRWRDEEDDHTQREEQQFMEEDHMLQQDMDWNYDQVDNWTKDQPPPRS